MFYEKNNRTGISVHWAEVMLATDMCIIARASNSREQVGERCVFALSLSL
jgi:hypothetical protein